MRQYEASIYYDTTDRIVITASKGLPGVGLLRKPVKGDTAYSIDSPYRQATDVSLEWEDIRALEVGTVRRHVSDDTQPGGPVQRVIEYVAPFTRCNREQDYRAAWDAF